MGAVNIPMIGKSKCEYKESWNRIEDKFLMLIWGFEPQSQE
jgi:hypothetical protein